MIVGVIYNIQKNEFWRKKGQNWSKMREREREKIRERKCDILCDERERERKRDTVMW